MRSVLIQYLEGKTAFRVSDLLNPIRKTGLFDSTQLAELEFEVVLENERRQPVPFALLLLKDTTRVDTLVADSTGRIILRFTPDHPPRPGNSCDPKWCSTNNQHPAVWDL